MRAVIITIALMPLLAGCISKREQMEAGPADDAYCQSIGARPGSDTYSRCRLQLRSELLERQAERRAAISRFGDGLAAIGAAQDAERAAARARSFDCTSTRFGDTTRTTCN